jgi:hypothetical protein
MFHFSGINREISARDAKWNPLKIPGAILYLLLFITSQDELWKSIGKTRIGRRRRTD